MTQCLASCRSVKPPTQVELMFAQVSHIEARLHAQLNRRMVSMDDYMQLTRLK